MTDFTEKCEAVAVVIAMGALCVWALSLEKAPTEPRVTDYPVHDFYCWPAHEEAGRVVAAGCEVAKR